jgi:hypothetical protein
VTVQSKVCTVLYFMDAGCGLKPCLGNGIFFLPTPVLVLSCVGRGLVMGQFPIEGALRYMYEQILKPGKWEAYC